MWPYYPDLLATPVPRYTSYPTAADFGDIPATAHREAIEQAGGDVSLYVHIPFCEKICYYCGCNTGAAGKSQRLRAYLDALHAEIETLATILPSSARIRRIAFGGGSPNAISAEAFLHLFDQLVGLFAIHDPQLSIELDPRTMTKQWASALAVTGMQRASLGVQTFAPQCQRAIGRVQGEDTIVRTVDWLREAGITSLNFDLMYGLPHQTREDLIDTLHRSRVLGADRIALFGYAHVPHMVPRQRVIDEATLPHQAERFAMAGTGFEYLATHGYLPVGFDHFAKAGSDPLAHAATEDRLYRNFQGFTDDSASNLIGLGSSAISAFPDLLAQNEKNSGRYRMLATQRQLTASRGARRSRDDQLRGKVIEALLCQGRAKIPAHILSEVACRLSTFVARGLASLDGEFLSITADGLPYARTIAALMDAYRAQSPRRFSAAV